MNNRIEQLDSIRGLAALCVFFGHIAGIHALPYLVAKLLSWPLKPLINGHAAVMFFFVLSGFVLSLPFLKNNEIEYLPYLIKRVFRIYFPYLFAIVISIFLSQHFSLEGPIEGYSNWFNAFWTSDSSTSVILEHFELIGNIHSDSYDPVIWSLIHELRISLFFPFVVLLVNRSNWKLNILLCFFLSSIGEINNVFQFQIAEGYLTTYFNTVHYLAIFIIGSLLAKHRANIIDFYQNLRIRNRYMAFFLSFLLYNFSDVIFSKIIPIPTVFFEIIKEYFISFGAVGFIVIALGSAKVGDLLRKGIVSFLGKISYSLYLYHLPILLSFVHLLHKTLSYWAIELLSLIVGIAVAAVAWYIIENPFIRLGKILALKVQGKLNKQTQVYGELP